MDSFAIICQSGCKKKGSVFVTKIDGLPAYHTTVASWWRAIFWGTAVHTIRSSVVATTTTRVARHIARVRLLKIGQSIIHVWGTVSCWECRAGQCRRGAGVRGVSQAVAVVGGCGGHRATVCKVESLWFHLRAYMAIIDIEHNPTKSSVGQVEIPQVLECHFIATILTMFRCVIV